MRLLNLRAHKFGVLTDVDLSFPDLPGFFYVTGRNDDQPRLGTNAIGKSTLWAALTWVFFNQTPRKLRASGVSPWKDPGDTWVEIDYTPDEEHVITVRRSWKPNTWTATTTNPLADGEVIDLTQDDGNFVLSDLRLSFDMWIRAVVNPQREPMFMDLKPEAKATLLTEALGLDVWLTRSQRAGQRAEAMTSAIISAEKEEARLAGLLEAHDEQAAAASEQWVRERDRRLDLVCRQHGELAGRHATVMGLRGEANDRLRLAEGKLLEARAVLDELGAQYDARRADLHRPTARLGNLDAQGEHLFHVLEKMKHATTCEVCGQGVSQAQVAKRTREIEAELFELDGQRDEAVNEIKAVEEDLRRVDVGLKEADDLFKDWKQTTDHRRLDLADLDRQLARLDQDLDRLEDEAEELDRQEEPRREADVSRQARQAELEATREKLARLYEEQALYRNWARWFKEIRLELLDEALVQLEIETNSALEELGLPDWEVKFSSDRESAKGITSKGFSVGIISPGNDKPIQWEAWSGGESQRLRLAGEMGLRDLIRDRMGASINLEVWDEPTEGLSPAGVVDLMACLRSRAKRTGRQIWLVDHHVMGASSFDGLLFITRTTTGSKFEWQTA